MRNSELRRAAAFCAVVRSGTLVAAAREIGRSPPAVHHELKLLEKELGEALFLKSGRTLQPTARARLLYEELRKALSDIEAAQRRFSERRPIESHRIACVSGFGRYRLAPELLRRAPKDHTIELWFGSHEQALEALVNAQVDVAITYKPVLSVPFEALPFADEELVVVMPHGSEMPITLDDWQHVPVITYDEYEYVFAHWFDQVFGRQPARLRRADHMSELDEALMSAAVGRGATIAPADAWHVIEKLAAPVMASTWGEAVRNEIFIVKRAGADTRTLAFVQALWNT
jgi:DNA-binding transcriptional LysR family regulator